MLETVDKQTTTPAIDLSVIIVSYNTREMTLECLGVLMPELTGLSSEIFLVDNASSDGSVAAVRAAFAEVHCIENPQNAGFGSANNLAMREARGEFLLLLNSDAFPKPGAISHLVSYLKTHPDVAVAGPRLLNQDESLQLSCFKFPTPLRCWMENLWLSAALPRHPKIGDYRLWPHDTERRVDSIIGACMLVRHSVYEQVGGFDERFFMYSEETDWQWRMQKAGWAVAFTPTAEVTHLAGASGASEKPRISRYFFDSLDWYVRKHHGWLGLISVRLAMVIGCGLRALLWSAVMLTLPRRRDFARSKASLLGWLVVRQATKWRAL